MRIFKGLVAAGLMFCVNTASAAPVEFTDNPEKQQARIVRALFPGYIGQRSGMVLETAILDLDLDKTGEIVARFVHSKSCSEGLEKCRTVVLKHYRQGTGDSWKIIFDRHTSDIEFGEPRRLVPAPVKADGVEWTYSYPSYRPVGVELSETVELAPVPPKNVKGIAGAFGVGAARLADNGSGYVSYEYGTAKTGDGTTLLVVKQKGKSACGDLTGCPVRVLRQKDGDWSTVLAAATVSGVSLTGDMRNGIPDLVTKTPKGFVIFGWADKHYGIVDRIEAVEVRR